MKKILLITLFGLFGISAGAQDSTGCDLIANFTYSVSGETLYLTNTSTDEPLWAYYNWSVDGLSSWEENPSFPTTDFETSEEVCLTVFDSTEECMDTYCMTLYFEEDSIFDDSTDCELVGSFTYVRSAETIYFTNTSTGEPMDVSYEWYIDFVLVSEEENPSFDVADFEPSKTMCLVLFNEDWSCQDSLCELITIDSIAIDSTASIELTEKVTVEIYPNPAQNVLNINLGNSNGNPQIAIYNTLGEMVRMDRIGLNNQATIDVSTLPNGLYIINIIDEENPTQSIQEKFIKN